MANSRLIPYQPLDLSEPSDLVAEIRKRRGGQLINLDRMLLHSEPFARGWNVFIGNVREKLSLDPRLRELSMCGVAILNGAEYEFFHHAPPFLKAGGTQEQVAAIRHLGQETFNPDCFSDIENDTLALTFQMTRNIKVESPLMERLLNALGNTVLVELVGVIASYNMVSRFLIALDIHPEDHPPTT